MDFRDAQPKIYLTLDELKHDGLVLNDFEDNFALLSPEGFAPDLLDAHAARHPIRHPPLNP